MAERSLGRDRDESPCGHRPALSFQLQRLERLGCHGLAGELHRPLTEQDLARVCRLLEPRGRGDGAPGREPFGGSDDDLAALEADPSFDPQLDDCVPHLDRCAQRSQGVVLVHRRQSEHGHHRVSDELLDDTAMALDGRRHPREVRVEQFSHRLGVK